MPRAGRCRCFTGSPYWCKRRLHTLWKNMLSHTTSPRWKPTGTGTHTHTHTHSHTWGGETLQNVPKRGRRYSLSLSDLALLALPRTLRLPHQGEGNAAFSKGCFWADQRKLLCRSVHKYLFLSLFLCVCVLMVRQ